MGVALLSKFGIASLGVGKCCMALAGDKWPCGIVSLGVSMTHRVRLVVSG